MIINISGLAEGEHRYERSAPASTLALAPELSGEVTVAITLEKSVHQILARIDASVKGVFICDRCANEFEKTVTASFVQVYSWESEGTHEDDDDFHLLRKDENLIDVSAAVSEYLTLAVPAKLLCGRTDCELPAEISADEKKTDPRWEKLQQLLRTEKN